MPKTIERCALCNHIIAKRKVVFNHSHLTATMKAFNYAMRHGTTRVHTPDLGLSNVEYTVFNYLIRFGLMYKTDDMKSGEYGVPRKRISEFLHGRWRVAEYIIRDPVTKTQTMSESRVFVFQVPKIKDVMAKYGPKLTEYVVESDPTDPLDPPINAQPDDDLDAHKIT